MGISQAMGPDSLRGGVCTSTTRPASPFEGQMIYETDTDMLAIWNGSAWRYIAATTPTNGTVLQIVNATYAVQTNSTSSTYADSGLSATITPKSSSSKVFIAINQSGWANAAGTSLGVRLVRDSTVMQTQVDTVYGASSSVLGAVCFMYLDSPATTTAVSYKTQFARLAGSGTVALQMNSNPSNITLMEIAG